MSEIEKYVPPEVQQSQDNVEKRVEMTGRGVGSIKGKVDDGGAKGEPANFVLPDGNQITPEKQEIHKSPETIVEKEPGHGPKPSFDSPPGGGNVPNDDNDAGQDADDE